MAEQTAHTDLPEIKRRSLFDASFVSISVLTVVAAIAVGIRDGGWAVLDIAGRNLGFLAALMPKIIAGVFSAAALPILVPREVVIRTIGEGSGMRGLLLASLAGLCIPGGPVMTFALAGGFLAAGAHLSTIIAFVTSWSLLGLNRTIIWEISFLKYEFVAYRYLICLPMPVLFGLIAARVLRR